eukprot:7059711-Alexandrium_andersonii.AAC.2
MSASSLYDCLRDRTPCPHMHMHMRAWMQTFGACGAGAGLRARKSIQTCRCAGARSCQRPNLFFSVLHVRARMRGSAQKLALKRPRARACAITAGDRSGAPSSSLAPHRRKPMMHEPPR